MEKRFFWKGNEVILYAENYKDVFESSLADVLDDYEKGDIYFAECHENVTDCFPLVFWELKEKNGGEPACAYLCLENDDLRLLPNKLNVRKLSPRDIGRKFLVPYKRRMLDARVIMGKNSQMAIKIKKSALS